MNAGVEGGRGNCEEIVRKSLRGVLYFMAPASPEGCGLIGEH